MKSSAIVGLVTGALLAAGCAAPTPAPVSVPALSQNESAETAREPLTWAQLAALTAPAPAVEHLPYAGDAPQQFGELRFPQTGTGPFPLVMLIHGGCWRARIGYEHMRPLAQALTGLGVATWTVEYRRLGDDNGGWPRTFRDVGLAADYVRTLARYYPIDPQRVIALGHSAGAQIALWLPTRARLPESSPLYRPDPLPLRGVIGLSAVTDLAAYRIGPRQGGCHSAVDKVIGADPEQKPQRYAQVSPIQRLPLGTPQWLIHGALDAVVSPESAAVYADRARRAGDRVTLQGIADAGHFETIAPQGDAWQAVRAAVAQALK